MTGSRWFPKSLNALFCVGLLALAACAPRPVAQRAAPNPEARAETIYVVTQRRLENAGPGFGRNRSSKINYFRADISVPPNHRPGQIEWPKGTPDAATDFVITGSEVYAGPAGLVRDVRKATPDRETMVFVHGYNNTLSEAMYRMAQIQRDFDIGGPAVLFSWPSAGDPRGYIYDRDSVLFSRDALEKTLLELTKDRREKVFLLAHSVGAQLTMEVLRQAAIRGDGRLLGRISGVVLMSPDIDPDVFRAQALAIGRLPQPFVIFISRQDKALSLAGLLTGRKPRLGVLVDEEDLRGLNVTVVDFSALADGEGFNHAVPMTSPKAIAALNEMIRRGERKRVRQRRNIILQPVF
ncbi:Lipoprotein, putative [hydrothermal vent metagenome]|uniref:Lipoprotein, putative n=1 Tax=hydrothermal vent metagenome TaxID=652676 RepID=A0A3B0RJQ4_9ZZZZ